MIFLYNKERVLLEGMELMKSKSSQRLGCDVNIISGGYKLHEGKLVPDLNVDTNKVPIGKLNEIDTILSETWGEVSDIIVERLEGLDSEA